MANQKDELLQISELVLFYINSFYPRQLAYMNDLW